MTRRDSDPPAILGFGSVALDELIYVDGPLDAGKGRVAETRFDHGGNVATALVAAASLGARAGFIGWLSSDPAYASVSTDLDAHGVDITRCSLASDAAPVRSTIIVGSDGERFIAWREGASTGPRADLSRSHLQGAKVLLVDSHAARALDAVQLAVDAGLAVVADVEWSAAGTGELLALAQHLVVPWDFAVSVAGEQTPRQLLDALWQPHHQVLVITHGSAGAYARFSDCARYWHVPACPVSVVDTTGCGDWFHGAYAAALCEGREPIECVRFATAAAAIAASGQGGRGVLATAEAVDPLLQHAPGPNVLSGG